MGAPRVNLRASSLRRDSTPYALRRGQPFTVGPYCLASQATGFGVSCSLWVRTPKATPLFSWVESQNGLESLGNPKVGALVKRLFCQISGKEILKLELWQRGGFHGLLLGRPPYKGYLIISAFQGFIYGLHNETVVGYLNSTIPGQAQECSQLLTCGVSLQVRYRWLFYSLSKYCACQYTCQYCSELGNLLLYQLSLRLGHLITRLGQEIKDLTGMNGLGLREETNQEFIYILYESSPLKC